MIGSVFIMYANSEADQINHFFVVNSLHFCDNYWHKGSSYNIKEVVS